MTKNEGLDFEEIFGMNPDYILVSQEEKGSIGMSGLHL